MVLKVTCILLLVLQVHAGPDVIGAFLTQARQGRLNGPEFDL